MRTSVLARVCSAGGDAACRRRAGWRRHRVDAYRATRGCGRPIVAPVYSPTRSSRHFRLTLRDWPMRSTGGHNRPPAPLTPSGITCVSALEHPFTARAPDALVALAQLEFARGDRSAARRRFDRVLRDYPSGRHVVRASLWSGRLAVEDRDYAIGCATLNSARPLVASDQIELRNQFDYFISQCERAPVTADTAATPAPNPTPDATTGTTGGQFSVQVAAYSARRDATAMATRLRERGFDVRVVGERAPFRVRIGRYPTRADGNGGPRPRCDRREWTAWSSRPSHQPRCADEP